MQKNRNFIEAIVGFIVLITAVLFATYSAYIASLFKTQELIIVQAKFSDIGGLKAGAPILAAGVPVGKIEKIELDKDFYAVAHLKLDKKFKIPSDSSFDVQTSLFGGATSISISPGFEKEYVKDGDTISNTTPPLSIMSLVSKFLINSSKEPVRAEKNESQQAFTKTIQEDEHIPDLTQLNEEDDIDFSFKPEKENLGNADFVKNTDHSEPIVLESVTDEGNGNEQENTQMPDNNENKFSIDKKKSDCNEGRVENQTLVEKDTHHSFQEQQKHQSKKLDEQKKTLGLKEDKNDSSSQDQEKDDENELQEDEFENSLEQAREDAMNRKNDLYKANYGSLKIRNDLQKEVKKDAVKIQDTSSNPNAEKPLEKGEKQIGTVNSTKKEPVVKQIINEKKTNNAQFIMEEIKQSN